MTCQAVICPPSCLQPHQKSETTGATRVAARDGEVLDTDGQPAPPPLTPPPPLLPPHTH